MKIELKCPCGATAVFDGPHSHYIVPGGYEDSEGRIYIVQIHADAWLDRHKDCKAIPAKVE